MITTNKPYEFYSFLRLTSRTVHTIFEGTHIHGFSPEYSSKTQRVDFITEAGQFRATHADEITIQRAIHSFWQKFTATLFRRTKW